MNCCLPFRSLAAMLDNPLYFRHHHHPRLPEVEGQSKHIKIILVFKAFQFLIYNHLGLINNCILHTSK